MSFLSNLSYQDNIAEDKDTLGGGFTILESGVYDATVKYAYLSQAKSGAGAVSNALIINELVHRVSEINQDIQDTVSAITGNH